MVASQSKVLLFLPLLLCACDTAPTAPGDSTAPIVPAAHTNSTAPTTLVLHTRHQFRYEASRSQSISGLLPRELGRQSLLIAARDELGMRTRDASLREVNAKQQIKVVAGGALPSAGVLGQNADAIELLLTVDAAIDGKCMLRISALREAKFHEIWSQELKFRAGGRETYTTLAPQFEALSRGEFVDVLKQLGATQRQVDAAPSLGADAETEKHDDDIDELLQNVDLFSQFLAVRRLHRENRASGDSPERLGQLAIGYANLGLLTECYWGATSRVFRARAMTYAERLKAKYAEDALSSWHWAYVYGVSGAHRPALQEAERLNSESETSDPKTPLPDWTSLIEPYCHYDIEALAVIADSDSSTRKWARYLRYWSLFNAGEKRLMTTEAQQLITDCHEAFNLYCLLSTEGQLGLMHRASQWSLQAMVGHCRQTIGGNPELPESVVAAATANPTRSAPLETWGATMAALREVDDAEAMSWGLLGTLMEETAVMVAALHLKVAQQASQEHSLQPYVDMFRPAIKYHPNVGFFDSAPHWRQGDMQALRNAGRELRFLDPTLWQRSHLHYLWSVRNTSGEQIGKNAYYCANRDFVVPQVVLAMRFQQNPDDFQEMLIKELGGLSPNSPIGLVHKVERHRKEASNVDAAQIATWKQQAGASAAVWRSLGTLLVARQEYAESYACFEKSFDLSSDEETAREWAWAYERDDQHEQVVPTFEKYLAVEDFGLGHSNTHYEIARYFLRQGNPTDARSHALTSAESWSGRGLGIAAVVCDRLGESEAADAWYQKLSEAYPTYSGLQWYLWRRRQGSDDMDQARALAKQELGAQELIDCSSNGWWPLTYYVMEDDEVRTLRFLKLRTGEEPTLYSFSHWLIAAARAGESTLQDAALEAMVAEAASEAAEGETQEWPEQYVSAIRHILDADSAGDVSTDVLSGVFQGDNAPMGWCDASYFFSQLLEFRGFSEHAKTYRDYAISLNKDSQITWHLAAFDAHRLNRSEASATDTTDPP